MHTLNLLEYSSALEMLAKETHSEAGRLAALGLSADLTAEEILDSWRFISEGREVLVLSDSLNLSNHLDLSELLEPLKIEGAILGVEDLHMVGLEARCANAARVFFAPLEAETPQLAALALNLCSLPELIEAIERSIGPDGEILDSASAELARLRMEQAATRQGITSRLTNLMQDNFKNLVQDQLITTRSDRFVLPVRAGAVGGGRGLVHDWSKTGATAFLEPMEVVEDNNKLGLLKRKEKTEIERILRRLSEQCRQAAAELVDSGAILTKLDLIMAQARLARRWAAIAPDYKAGEGIHLLDARHPILMERLEKQGGRMTPLELKIENNKPLMVISGLNTGGKTVAMKTMGLNLLLVKAGLHIPVAEGSYLDFPDEIYAVIGDEQDLSSDLSTFSGHVKSLDLILKKAKAGVLILLDEIGSGTDPAEGAALGLAVLETLLPSGALIMAATHYQLIKNWAALNDNVLSVAVNASDSGQALYGLSYGSPGFSGGLKMARRLGLPDTLLQRAESYLDEGQKKAMDLLAKLDDERGRLLGEREALESERLSLARAEKDLRDLQKLESEKWEKKSKNQNQLISDALAKSKLEFEELKKEMKAALDLKDNSGSRQIAFSERHSKIERNLRAVRPQVERNENPLSDVQVGDAVMVPRLGRKAVVRSLNQEKGEAWVDADGLNVKLNLNELYALPAEGRDKEKSSVSVTITPAQRDNSSLEINLLGQTVDEAIDLISKELDRAVLDRRQRVYIVHGFGTGRLRQGIRAFLKRHPRVSHFERAAQNAGGDGVTIASIE